METSDLEYIERWIRAETPVYGVFKGSPLGMLQTLVDGYKKLQAENLKLKEELRVKTPR